MLEEGEIKIERERENWRASSAREKEGGLSWRRANMLEEGEIKRERERERERERKLKGK